MGKPKIGLALSGGGIRGFVHIGVLKVFEEENLPIDFISGTSMGGIIAASFASGIPISEIEEIALRLSHLRELMKLIDLSPQRRGLLEGQKVHDFLARLFIDRTFDSLKIPLAIPAVDIIESREVVFTKGLLLPALMATTAVPGLFAPVKIGDCRFIDGGILNNLPVDCVRNLGATLVIAIDAQPDPFQEKPWQEQDSPSHFPVPLPSFFLDFYRAELIMIAEITQSKLKETCPEILMRPPIPKDIMMFLGWHRIEEVIAAGESCARGMLPHIRNIISSFPN
jgi:NTE family protein